MKDPPRGAMPGGKTRGDMAQLVCSLSGGGVGAPEGRSWERLSAGPQARLRILQRHRRIAMVGLSANPLRPSHFAAIYLANRGYDIVPVNPRAERILGRHCFPSLTSLEQPVEVVDIFRPARYVPAIVEEAIATGAKVVWMQFGVIHEEAALRALDAGLEVVMDHCMKVEHARFFGALSALGLNSGVVSSRNWHPEEGRRGLG